MKARKSWAMAYCGMAAALSVALMLLGAILPLAMFIAPAVAGFLILTVCVECGRKMAFTSYAAVSLLGLLFVPDKEVALIFAVLLGYYPLVKSAFERIRPAFLRVGCKLLLCNAAVLAMYSLLYLLFPAGEAAQELKAMDEHTAVTEYHIRQLALSGVLPRVQAGRKLLINFDLLLEYLENPAADKFQVHSNAAADVNGIRRIV